jgi:hypothetical protein
MIVGEGTRRGEIGGTLHSPPAGRATLLRRSVWHSGIAWSLPSALFLRPPTGVRGVLPNAGLTSAAGLGSEPIFYYLRDALA